MDADLLPRGGDEGELPGVADELLAAALQRSGAHLIGGLTAGHAPHMRFIQNGDLNLWLPVGRWQRADGTAINGNGVEPDELVEAAADDDDSDPVLERALELAVAPLEQAA